MRTILLLTLTLIVQSIHAQDKQLVQALDALINSRFPPNDPGGSIQVRKQGKVIYSKSFGVADIKTGKKFTNKTLANVGSITKTFVAYTILDLANNKKLSLNDNLLKYFPGFQNHSLAERVTIWHLLSHSSGLPDLRQTETDSIYYLTARDAENFAPLFQADSLEFEPGSNWNYSNPAYNGLALIIEKATGKKWQQVVKESVFEKAGMTRSTITDGSFPSSGVSHGYRYYHDAWDEYDYGEYPTFAAAGNGGAWCSVEELTKYVDALHQNKLLDSPTTAFSFTAPVPSTWKQSQPPVHGCCWFAYQPDAAGIYELVEHAGFQGGFRSHILMYTQEKLDIIWIDNNDTDLSGLIIPILQRLRYIPFAVDFH